MIFDIPFRRRVRHTEVLAHKIQQKSYFYKPKSAPLISSMSPLTSHTVPPALSALVTRCCVLVSHHLRTKSPSMIPRPPIPSVSTCLYARGFRLQGWESSEV